MKSLIFIISFLLFCILLKKIRRFLEYRTRLKYGPYYQFHKPRYSFDGKPYIQSHDKDDEAEQQLAEIEMQMLEFDHLLNKPSLNPEEQSSIKLQVLENLSRKQAQRTHQIELKNAQILITADEKFLKEKKEWEKMIQDAKNKGLWWQFWHS